MDWLNGIEVLAMASPVVAVIVAVMVCVIVLALVAGMAGAPMPWNGRRRTADFEDTEPASAAGLAWRTPAPPIPPLRISEPAPPVIRNMGSTPLHVQMVDGSVRVFSPDGSVRVLPPEGKDCCGACDGSQCGDKPASSASAPVSLPKAPPVPDAFLDRVPPLLQTMTADELRRFNERRAREKSALQRSLSAQPGHNPPRPWPAPSRPVAPAPAARRRRDEDDDQPYQGSYYGQSVSQVMNSEVPAPSFRSGGGGEASGGGASGTWGGSDDTCRAPAPSPSYDSGSSSSYVSSSDSGGSDGGSSGGCGVSD